MVYVGMDVHRKRSQIAILDEKGKELLNRNFPNDPSEIASVLGTLEPKTPVAFEAAYGWSWLHKLLQEIDLEPHLAHPGGAKAIAWARLKNDKVDARTLAHLLRTDLLPEAWIAPADVKDLRTLMRHRAALVRTTSSLKTRIRAVLADEGLDYEGLLWTKAGHSWLRELDLPGAKKTSVVDNLVLIESIHPMILSVEKQIQARAKPDPRVNALMELPGVGLLTAMMIVAEVGDIDRFPTARKLSAWTGLTPSVHNSDTKVRHGHITKQGSTWLRWVLVEAAHVASKHPPFSKTYDDIARRRGKKIAAVAVARKLLCRSFHILKQVSNSLDQEKASASGALVPSHGLR